MNLSAIFSKLKKSRSVKILVGCFIAVVFWRIGLELLNQLIVPSIMRPGTPWEIAGTHGLSRWALWDGQWYKLIAEQGYVIINGLKGPETVAFFPAFPLFVGIVAKILHSNVLLTGLILNILITAVTCYYVYLLTEHFVMQAKVKTKFLPELAVAFLLINPSSFFMAAFYADALLILLFTACIYYCLKSKYFLAALLAGVASATKSTGAMLFPAIALIMLYQNQQKTLKDTILKNLKNIVITGAISISGIVAYMTYLYVRFNDPLLFITIQQYWSRKLSGFFIKTIWEVYYNHIFQPHYFESRLGYFYHLFAMLFPVGAISLCIYFVVKYKMKYAWLVYLTIAVTFIPLTTGSILSDNRYCLVLTPITSYFVVYLGKLADKKRMSLIAAILYFSSIALVIFTIAFLSVRFVG